MDKSDLSSRCKAFEAVTEQRALRGLPLLVRLDGRAFHTYTSGLKRPFDERLSHAMMETTKTLIEDLHAAVGYTQSDEISLLFYADPTIPTSCLPFDGRILKIATVLAGLASAKFARLTSVVIPEKDHITPHFDSRAWSVPTPQDAVDTFAWRVQDATKNSVSMAAQACYSHKQLLNKNTSTKLVMLQDKGINWSSYPDFFRVGCFFRRRTIERLLTPEEHNDIPVKYRPPIDQPVIRSSVMADIPPATLTWQWLLNGE